MKWKHEFYQDNPNTNDKYDFYHSQRRAFAILEVVREIKSNYYLIADADQLSKFGINAFEYSEMPVEEVKEVFINLED